MEKLIYRETFFLEMSIPQTYEWTSFNGFLSLFVIGKITFKSYSNFVEDSMSVIV